MDAKNKNNPFRKENGAREEKSKKEIEWGKVKFNPVAKTAVMEKATPWSQFKNEIIQKQQEDINETQYNKTNTNAKAFLKKREENYRRNLIESKRNEPTKWEDFSEEPAQNKKTKNKEKSKFRVEGRFQAIPSNIRDFDSITKKNFDSRELTSQQNNFLKKFITKQTFKRKGTTFKQALEDLKLHGVKKIPFKK